MISEIPEFIDGQIHSKCICPAGHIFHVAWECRHNHLYCPECNAEVEA